MKNELTINRLMNQLMLGIFFGIIIIAIVIFIFDANRLLSVFRGFPLDAFTLSISLVLIGYVFRYWKWHRMVATIPNQIPLRDHIVIYLIGMAMSITPGKLGELVKSFLLQKRGIPVAQSTPVVFLDRFTDVLAMAFFVSIGMNFVSSTYTEAIVFIFFMILLLILIRNRSFVRLMINFITKFRLFSKFKPSLEIFADSSYQLTRVSRILPTIALSVIAWGFEVVSFYIILQSLGIDLSFTVVMFIFSFGTILGAISFLPGGIGVAEGSIAGLLLFYQIPLDKALIATMLIRFNTLWLGVILGVIVFLLFRKKYFTTNHSIH